MKTKLLLRFVITHPDADLRYHDFQQSPDPLLDFWQAVGAVFSQMLEQMDDRALAAALERRAIAREGLYDAASDERGLHSIGHCAKRVGGLSGS
jgi:hypothetical protein